jgi:hypothetical protein
MDSIMLDMSNGLVEFFTWPRWTSTSKTFTSFIIFFFCVIFVYLFMW